MTNFVEFIYDSGVILLINIGDIRDIAPRYGDSSMSTITFKNDDFYYVKHTYEEVISMISQCNVSIVRLKN